jgi:hypothetical protein
MPQIATEIATLPLLPDIDIDTPGGEGHNVINGMIETLGKQKGYLGLHYGRQHENPDNLVLAIGLYSITISPVQPRNKMRH